MNNYSNLVITAADGSGDHINGGEVLAYGLEVSAGHKIKSSIAKKTVTFPIRANYTYNHSEFKNSFDASDTIDEWGNVSEGDRLPYIAPHQFSLSVGVEVDQIAFDLRGKYVDAMRTVAGQGSIDKSEKIPSHFVADASLFYDYSKKVKLIAAVDNVFDRRYAISARPAGLFAGKPRTFRVGTKVSF
jgi:Fe(3+) dicitrate transport protein